MAPMISNRIIDDENDSHSKLYRISSTRNSSSKRRFSNNNKIVTNVLLAIFITVALLLLFLIKANKGEPGQSAWTYEDQQKWAEKYPQCVKNGPRQSPIDIITDEVIYNPHICIDLLDYNQEVEFQIKNTHHSVSFTPVPYIPDNKPKVKLCWLDDDNEFELNDIHFHWGDHDKKGSEHLVNGERSEAEMHMVHYRKGVDKEKIGLVPDSVLVIGVFIKSEPEDNNKFDVVVSGTQKVNGTDNMITTENNDVINLLPDDVQSFYTYNGSLTTPPCYEIVTWVVMKDPVFLGRHQLSELADLYADDHGEVSKIGPNFRETQQLSGRRVYSSFPITPANQEYPMFPAMIDDVPGDPNRIDVNFEDLLSPLEEEIKHKLSELSTQIEGRRNSNLLNNLGRQASQFGNNRRRRLIRFRRRH